MKLKLSSKGVLTISNSVLSAYPVGMHSYRVVIDARSYSLSDSYQVIGLTPGTISLFIDEQEVERINYYPEDLTNFYKVELESLTGRSWRGSGDYRRRHMELDQARFEFVSSNPHGSLVYVKSQTATLR